MERLPFGIGRFGMGSLGLILALAAIAAWGAYAFSVQLDRGLVVTGLRDVGPQGGAAWGLYVAFNVYFVGISFAGITTAAVIRLLNLEHMRPVSRMAELLTIIALLLAGIAVLADVGQPLRALVNLPLYTRPQSPFFGDFTLVVAGYLFASLIYFYLEGRRDAAVCAQVPSRLQWLHRLWAAGYRDTPQERQRHEHATFFLALGIIPLLITAHSTLGFIFGLQIGRPGWFSALQAPGFVVMAGVSGIGMLIVIAALLRGALGERERLSLPVFRWLGNMLMVLTAIYLYFILVEWLTTVYQGPHHDAHVMQAMQTGDFAWLYWLSIATLVVPFGLLLGQFVMRRYSLGLIALSGLLVNVAAVGKRLLLIAPSQVLGSLLPYEPGSYGPTWVEYSIIVGLVGLGGVLYVLFMKAFPIMETQGALPAVETAPGLGRPGWAPAWRPGLMVLAGVALMVTSYFLLGAPWGFPPSSPVYSNPQALAVPTVVAVGTTRLDWVTDALASPPAPLLFVVGVMLVYSAAVVYELAPGVRRRARGRARDASTS